MRVIALLLLLCCLAPLSASVWIAHPCPVAYVYVHPGEERTANWIASIVDEEGRRLAPALGLSTIRPFALYAYTDRSEFQQDAGSRPLLVGISYRPSGLIRIDVTGQEGPVQAVLGHEMTHTLLNQRLGDAIDRLPNWVNEGMAGYLAAPISPEELKVFAQQVPRQGTLSLRGMELAFDIGGYVDAAYQQSCSMIAWLEYHHPGAIAALIDRMARGSGFDEALQATADLSSQQWLDKWRTQLPLSAWVISILSSPAAYAPFAIIIIVAFTMGIRRKLTEQRTREEAATTANADVLPYPAAAVIVDLSSGDPDLSHFPIWDDIYTP